MNSSDALAALSAVLEARKTASPDSSYVASLYAKGVDAIARKIGEEATETVIAAKNDDDQALICEIADLWFHSLVLLAHRGLSSAAVVAELERRLGTSGLTEKASRVK